jgi:hypothetical protein
MGINWEGYQIELQCDDEAHGPGDQRALKTFTGEDRDAAIRMGVRCGWHINPNGEMRVFCPSHAPRDHSADRDQREDAPYVNALREIARRRSEIGVRLTSAGDRRIHQESLNLAARAASIAEAALPYTTGSPGRYFEVERMPGGTGFAVQPVSDAGTWLGYMLVLNVERSWDRIEPPGVGTEPYGSGKDILLQRTPPGPHANDYEMKTWRASLRSPLIEALATLRGGEEAAQWIGARSLEWHVENSDIWGAVFANSGSHPWWQEDGVAEKAGRDFVAAAMRMFSSPLLQLYEHAVSRRRRR